MTVLERARVLSADAVRDLDDHLGRGGGRALEVAGRAGGDAVLATIEASGLRGRGGGGFPTAAKWRTVLQHRPRDHGAAVVVNGAEGEPGCFKDRAILRANPYAVVEGALIAARTIGATEVIVALKGSFDEERRRVQAAIDEVVAAGWASGLDLRVAIGPSAYLFGEETALLEALDGGQPFPRIAPPWRLGVEDELGGPERPGEAQLSGVDAPTTVPPALVNNVETMANVAWVVAEGPEAFRAVGTPRSPGTVVCTISGESARAGVVEVAMGTPLREVLDHFGGGRRGEVVGVLSGVANPILPADRLDTPLTYEDMAAAGAGLGAAGFLVFDEATDLLAVAAGVARFLAVESCGQCRPCKVDGLAIAERLERLAASRPEADDVAATLDHLATVADGARCNLARQTEAVIGSVLELFPEVLRAHAEGTAEPVGLYPIAPIVGFEDDRAVLDGDQVGKQPDWSHSEVWSGQFPVDVAGQPDRTI